MVINTCIILCEVLFVCLRIIYWYFFHCLCDFFRCVTSAKEWRKRTCPCTADVPETLNSRSQPRFLLSHTSFSLVKKVTLSIFLTGYFSPSSLQNFSEQIAVFRNIASHYSMSFLEETIDWLVVMSPHINQSARWMLHQRRLRSLRCICGDRSSIWERLCCCLMVCRQEAGDAGWKIWRLCWTVDIFVLMMSSWNYVCVNFRYWLLIKMFSMCFNCEPEGLCCSSVSLSAVKEKSVNILSGVPLCVPSLISGHILSELPPHLAANVSAVACAQLVTWSAPTAPQWKRIRRIWWCTIASRRAFHSCGGCEDSLDCHVWDCTGCRNILDNRDKKIKMLICW